MPQDKIKKIHLIYGCIASVLIIALGISLIVSCLDIYNSGARPYTPEAIEMRFSRIAILAYSCIAVVIGGIILGLLLPIEGQRPKAVKDQLALLEKARAKAGALPAEAHTQQVYRRCLRSITAAIFAGLMVYPAIYFMNPDNFTITSLNEDIARAAIIVMIPAGIGLALCFACSLLEGKSIEKEIAICKQAAQDTTNTVAPVRKTVNLTYIRLGLLALAVCLIVLGIFNGGMKDVLDKAVAICTECIGLG